MKKSAQIGRKDAGATSALASSASVRLGPVPYLLAGGNPSWKEVREPMIGNTRALQKLARLDARDPNALELLLGLKTLRLTG